MSNQQALLQILDLSIQSSGGRIHDFQFTGQRGSLFVFFSEDLRRITALFKTLKGLEKPLEGTISFTGEGMGLVLAEDELPPWSTPRWELGLFASLHGISRYDLNEAMGRWDLEGIHHLVLRRLNAYEKAGLCLVMEMALAPDMLLCQEPLAGLNPKQTEKMLDHLRDYAKDHLVILGTVNPDHYPAQLSRIDLDRQNPILKTPAAWKNEEAAPGEAAAEIKAETPSPPGAAAVAAATVPPDHQAPVTVIVPLPVNEATEYELRRISEIKYFEAAENGQGYAVDILGPERDHLRELLARRGLILPADWEG